MIGEKLCYAIVYAVEAMIALWYFESLFARKRHLLNTFLFLGLCYLVLYGISFLDITALNTISFFAANLVILYTNFYCPLKTAILHSAFLSFIMTIAEVLIALLIQVFLNDFAAYTYNLSVMVIMAILSKSLYLVFALIGTKMYSPHKHTTEEPHMMLLFCLLPIISAILSVLIVYIGLNSDLTRATEYMMLINVSALLIVNLIFLMLYNYIQKSNEDNLALQLSIQKDAADAEYYGALQEQAENQRILIHDIKNHLRTIEGLAERKNTDEIVRYISQLESTLSPSFQSRLCSDPILNIILHHFVKEFQSREIEFHLDIRENCTTFMDAPSITTLYGNLLSNALEAAINSDEKYIELSVIRNTSQSTILISVINSCQDTPIRNSSGTFESTKSDGIHGFGLKSIDRIVRKYKGMSTMYFNQSEQRFHHIIHFPYN